MKAVLLFNLRAADRRRVERAVGKLDQFADRVLRAVVRDDERARDFILAAQRAAGRSFVFLVMEEIDFVKSWGVVSDEIAFGGPFRSTSNQHQGVEGAL